MDNVRAILKDSDAWLLEQSLRPDGDVAREFRGFDSIILDDYDVWSYQINAGQ